jgi:hypothetical protein
MEKDRRRFYNWMMVLLLNVGIFMITFFVSMKFSEWRGLDMGQWAYPAFFSLGISAFMTIVPMLLSKTVSKMRTVVASLVPLLLVILAGYFTWHNYTCTGKWCNIVDLPLAWTSGLSAFTFALYYAIGVSSRKWGQKTVLILALTVPAVLLGATWIIFSHYFFAE